MAVSLGWLASFSARGACAPRAHRFLAVCFSASAFLAGLQAQTPDDLEAGRTQDRNEPVKTAPVIPTREPEVPIAPPQETVKPAQVHEGYARVKSSGAVARRYAGPNEDVFRSLEAGTVVLVRGNYNGWWRVSVPGGLEGWVSTSFFKPGENEREWIVSADRVNFRVRPTTTDNAPLEPDRLERGERVLVLEQAGDWVRVQAPPRVSAWIDSTQLEVLSDVAAAEKQFADQQSEYFATLVGSMEKEERERRYLASDEYADKMLLPATEFANTELAKGTSADVAAVRATYRALLEPAAAGRRPSASLRTKVEARLAELDGIESTLKFDEIQRRTDAEMEKIKADAELAREEILKRDEKKHEPTPDPVLENWQHFGWLRKEGESTLSSGAVRYVLERGKLPKINVMCESGRYDLTDYIGREIAVTGFERSQFSLPVFDVKQIRILTSKKSE